MEPSPENTLTGRQNWLKAADFNLQDLVTVLSSNLALSDLRYACDLQQQVPLYDGPALLAQIHADPTGEQRAQMQSEWQWIWQSGPGILVIKRAFADTEVLDRAKSLFDEIYQQEKLTNLSATDHFAKPGANERIWNAAEKLCVKDPELFARYYSNELLRLAATAWLGPGYQITSQTNSVNPGGEAQVAHRDYHLGFMTPQQAEAYPEHIHRLSPMLTLQCAIAHVDMPLVSGPTLYLPHSQKYPLGYLLADCAPLHDYFKTHRVQLPLEKGDLVLFNPALFHAAGSNTSKDIKRAANLLQISSAFGRAMESVDRAKMSRLLFPELKALAASGELSADQMEAVIAASAEGYAFPTNLDLDPPRGGLAPPNQQALLRQALAEHWSPEAFALALEHHGHKRTT
ncbi:phytanoyl-CoA dioxygenase family protein [Reinekea sp.]|jgi:ectoine hydroxylase-related dioxygenase (phytanoyl-CoA dioxygenase family)|uniref:phytanoyl-CoA dioxygenase family protein n=1 Tax=Reinekea sp. TaxID=1970455 RepID=UPI002A805496|nr:phytanoyl-CoA dioxygenase family protein [Reinekea sp.]